MTKLTRDLLEGNLFDQLTEIGQRLDRLERARAADKDETAAVTATELILVDVKTGMAIRLLCDSTEGGDNRPRLYVEEVNPTTVMFTIQGGEGGAQ
jgi:hypothetical protein